MTERMRVISNDRDRVREIERTRVMVSERDRENKGNGE